MSWAIVSGVLLLSICFMTEKMEQEDNHEKKISKDEVD